MISVYTDIITDRVCWTVKICVNIITSIVALLSSLYFLFCRCLEYTNVAPFLGMTRIATGNRRDKDSSLGESEDLNEKVSAFIFKGDLVSARVYRKRKLSSMQKFIPEMIQSLLCGLNYLHRERLVHMELNLNTVMVRNLKLV